MLKESKPAKKAMGASDENLHAALIGLRLPCVGQEAD